MSACYFVNRLCSSVPLCMLRQCKDGRRLNLPCHKTHESIISVNNMSTLWAFFTLSRFPIHSFIHKSNPLMHMLWLLLIVKFWPFKSGYLVIFQKKINFTIFINPWIFQILLQDSDLNLCCVQPDLPSAYFGFSVFKSVFCWCYVYLLFMSLFCSCSTCLFPHQEWQFNSKV